MNGMVLGARYEIREKVDSGGMADIYTAFCRKTKSIVAVKVLKECFSNNAEYIDRFKREAEAVFSLDHKNIVRVTDIGLDEGAYYMVMEYIEGSTLKNIVEQRPIGEDEAVKYAIQTCSALAAAHKKGIIHRDIKPHNILIDKEGNVKLTDFGIAKSISTREEQANQVIGSVHYISPEQAKGERVDTRTDIYSLGIVLYEMLTGALPHTGGETVSVALKHINEQITPPAELNKSISQAVNYIVLKATSKSKRDRYQSMDDFKSDLVLSLADPEGSFVDIPSVYRNAADRPASARKKNLYWKVGMLFLLVAVIASLVTAGFLVFGSPSKQAFFVPDFVGSTIDSAEKNFSNLSVNTTYEPSESAAEGTIVSQSPQGGTRSSNNSVSLTISSGPSEPVMPDLFGVTLEEAKLQLKSMGLVVGNDNIAYDNIPGAPPDTVVSQTPEADTPITGTEILSLTVSGGPMEENTIMPGLGDKLVDQAVLFLRDSGFNNCFVYEEDSDRQEGTVIKQSPEQGTQTPYSDNVYITISKYKSQNYKGTLAAAVDITDKESKVMVVLQETINAETINFVKKESIEDIGLLSLNVDLSSISGGSKNVVVYVNGQSVYSGGVEFH